MLGEGNKAEWAEGMKGLGNAGARGMKGLGQFAAKSTKSHLCIFFLKNGSLR